MDVTVRPLREDDLPAAEQIRRLAFGTFRGVPDPASFGADTEYARTRWLADPSAAFGAEVDGRLVGSNFATNWGSLGFFGPLTVHPEFWDGGIATRLLEPTMDRFTSWGTAHVGLFTFAQSAKHVGLYQKFGFWPRFLTAIMSRPASPAGPVPDWTGYSEVPERERDGWLAGCRELTGAILEGLDVGREIRAIASQGLGETVLLQDDGRLVGLAACHCGPGTEAGNDSCYIKFGAVRPGPAAAQTFDRLLDACAALAVTRGLSHLIGGVNTARHGAYRQMIARGFRTLGQGVVMDRPNEPGYNRPDAYLVDDWR